MPRRAEVGDRAFLAARPARDADVAAVQDQPVVGAGLQVVGDDSHELRLHLVRRLASGQAQAMAHTEDVGVDGDGGLDAQFVQHHRGGLAPDARQGLQLLPLQRRLAAVLDRKSVV